MTFYCDSCKKMIPRSKVRQKMWEEFYRCKWCGSPVYRTEKLLAGILSDYIEYAQKKGIDLESYE